MSVKVVASNPKAFHDYFIEDRYEAGIVLTGSEIKSVREGRVNLRDSFVLIKDGEAWLMDAHIAPYKQAGRENHDPRRPRKLLLHRYQINRLMGKVREKGYTIVPLQMYIKGRWAKVEIALAKGKKLYDKRRAIAEREAERKIRRALRGLDDY
ncbi:MAG: SsrA-binding protein SmpB [Anaerolineae bacterium]|nr:SsrA-binding protein SmpB [Anaerolineae bacterium]